MTMERLALAMVSVYPDQGRDHLDKIVTAVTEWDKVLLWAGKHGLLPILTVTLRAAGPDKVPHEVLLRLETRQREHSRRAMVQLAALLEIERRCKTQAVRMVSWKGPTLAVTLYKQLFDREFNDLDFLVSPHELSAATAVLEGLSFIRHHKATQTKHKRQIARLDRELCFFRSSDGVYVELHSALLPARFAFWQDGKAVLERASITSIHSVDVPSFCASDLLLALCGHGIKHQWDRLKWLLDISLFVRRYASEMDWDSLLLRARETGRSLALVHGILLACAVFPPGDAEIPYRTCAEAHMTEPVTQLMEKRICEQVLSPLTNEQQSALLNLMFPSRISRVIFTARRAFEPNLVDFDTERSRSVFLSKWSRLLRNSSGVSHTLQKITSSLRRSW